MKYDKWTYDVLDFCQRLHQSVTGSGDIIYGEERGQMLATLAMRIATWDKTKESRYDQAVKNLIQETLKEQINGRAIVLTDETDRCKVTDQ